MAPKAEFSISPRPPPAASPSSITTTTGGPISSSLAAHAWTDAPPEATNRLYRNNHDGTFTDVTDKAGLRRTGWAQGVAVGDYDNDGHLDLFVTYWGDNALYRNNGDGTFTDVAAKAGLIPRKPAHPTWYSGATFVDYDRDGKLDLFVAHLHRLRPAPRSQARRQSQLQLEGRADSLRPARPRSRPPLPVSQSRRRHV